MTMPELFALARKYRLSPRVGMSKDELCELLSIGGSSARASRTRCAAGWVPTETDAEYPFIAFVGERIPKTYRAVGDFVVVHSPDGSSEGTRVRGSTREARSIAEKDAATLGFMMMGLRDRFKEMEEVAAAGFDPEETKAEAQKRIEQLQDILRPGERYTKDRTEILKMIRSLMGGGELKKFA